jgi:poly(A) polymerase
MHLPLERFFGAKYTQSDHNFLQSEFHGDCDRGARLQRRIEQALGQTVARPNLQTDSEFDTSPSPFRITLMSDLSIGHYAENEPAVRPRGDADRVREALGYALVCARAPGNARHATDPLPEATVKVNALDVRALPVSEMRERLDEVVVSKRADRGLMALRGAGVLQVLMPEVTALVGFGEGEVRHKDVWAHTLQVVIQSVPRLNVRWAALFHDIGKPRTRSFDPSGTVHFLHHAEVGARMFDKLARRERLFDDALREDIRFLIYHHRRAHQYDDTWTDSATRRFAREVGPALDDLMALSRADMTTKRKEKRRKFLEQLKELTVRIEALQEEDAKPKALPKGLGAALIEEFKLPPSKLVGDIRKALEAAVESGELPLQADFGLYLDFVRQHAERFKLPRPE